jgi:hypothetical protein
MLRSIAFGGGGLRGILHAGIYRAISEAHPSMDFPDGIYGCSVGCLFAIGAAYRLHPDQVDSLCMKYMTTDSFLGRITLENLQTLLEKRGLVTTETLLTMTLEVFDSCGIDLRDKTIDDLPQKVYFVSSNLTTERPSLLTGKIPVLKALACSSCIPYIFIPEVLNGDVHLDGGVYTRCLREIVPSETIVFHLTRTDSFVAPTTGSVFDILASMIRGPRYLHSGPNTFKVDNRSVTVLGDLTDHEKKEAIEGGYLQARAFFAKRLAQELK